ncbi:MAG: NeuD/PglB/VioB family sugar acetyltransferase [Proteobacteria bacterium]|nr:NeuD/PglB/VioB family sugar acetyltransferase [Pseudomonadota bacterium]
MAEQSRVAIYGAGDLGHSLARILAVRGTEVSGFLDDRLPVGDTFCDLPVLGPGRDAGLLTARDNGLSIAFAIGYRRFDLRASRFEALRRQGVRFARCIHPSAVVDPTVTLGQGVVLFAGAVVDHGCAIGDNVLLNTGATVAHDTRIEPHAFLSPSCVLAGFVHVERCAWIGLGANIVDHVTIGRGAVVAAGAVVLRDVEPFTMVAGVPAQVKKHIEPFDCGGQG